MTTVVLTLFLSYDIADTPPDEIFTTLGRFADSIESYSFVALTETFVMNVSDCVTMRFQLLTLHILSYSAQLLAGAVVNFNYLHHMAHSIRE